MDLLFPSLFLLLALLLPFSAGQTQISDACLFTGSLANTPWGAACSSACTAYPNNIICVGSSPAVVTAIFLTGVSGTLQYDDTTTNLGSLITLSITNSPKLTGAIPTTFATLTNLKNLVLSSNGLSGTVPTFVYLAGIFGAMEALDLSQNSGLSGTLHLEAYTGLKSVSVAGTGISCVVFASGTTASCADNVNKACTCGTGGTPTPSTTPSTTPPPSGPAGSMSPPSDSSNQSSGLSSGAMIGIGVGAGVVGLIVLVLVIVCVVRRGVGGGGATPNYALPPEILKFSERSGSGWKQDKSVAALWTKTIEPGSKDYNTFKSIFEGKLNGAEYKLASVKVVNNENIWNTFSGYYPIMINRIKSDPGTFDKKDWKSKDDSELREWYVGEYQSFCKQFEWNDGLELPIIPSVHGTSGAIARKICENGFVALSILDQGFYGKGIYFTCHALYAIPYIASKSTPTLIISLIVPASIFPVTEHPNQPKSFIGASLVAGHQSHFVLTGKKGYPIKEVGKKYYTEIVIQQESQIVPIYLVEIDPSCLASLGMKWARVTAEDRQNMVQQPPDDPKPDSVKVDGDDKSDHTE